MNLIEVLELAKSKQFVALILDNEVTVGEFVTSPPLAWHRIIQQNGSFKVAAGYPTRLTAQQAKFEMTNWDQVSLPGIIGSLSELAPALDFIVIGNNAGQGLPLAQAVPQELRCTHSAVIYAMALRERSLYERLGYEIFFRRGETITHLLGYAQTAERPLALYFMNTIQHNERNYHHP